MRTFLLALLGLAVLATGCDDNTSDGNSPSGPSSGTTVAPPPPPPPAP